MLKRGRGPVTAVAALLLVIALAGCGGRAGGEDVAEDRESTEDTRSEVSKRDEVESSLTVQVRGDVEFDWSGVNIVHTVRHGGPEFNSNLYSAGFADMQQLEDPADRFRWAVDLLNAFDGPGRYEFHGASSGGFSNIAFLIFMRVKDPDAELVYEMDELERYDEFREIRKPCTLEVGADELSGTLTCPELASEDGETVSMTVTWTPLE